MTAPAKPQDARNYRKFWSVSYAVSPRDNGHCVTFDTEAKAREFAAELRANNADSVSVWC